MRPHRPALLVALLALLLLVAAGCGGGSKSAKSKGTVVLGTKNFPEEFILGRLYKQALEAKGFNVVYKENIGSTELIDTALTSGRIDMYPEYTGVIVQDVFGHRLSAKTAEATYRLAKKLEETRGFTLLDRTPFSDTDAVAVLKSTAAKDHLRSLGDLKHVPGLRLGGLPEFRTRNTGLVGLRQNYGLTDVDFVPLAGISPYVALDSHKVDAAAVFSTDPPLGKNSKYVVLADPVHQFGFQNAAPVVSQKLVDKLGSDFANTLNAVSAKLTQNAIVAMNRAVIVDKQKPAAVAHTFLQANQLD
ncbi:MAG: glycine betaine ABC transporter substrate-binding protein [Gaiellaceae bacterium]